MAYTLHTLSTLLASTTSSDAIPLTTHEALSGLLGSISLCSWIFVLAPQLYENYREHSAAGVSLLFLVIWLVGDIANLIGAIWAELVPTVTALAIYFCFADVVLIIQVLYYEYWVKRRRELAEEQEEAEAEEEPLLGRRTSNSSVGLPGSHQRRRRSAFENGNGITEGQTQLTNGSNGQDGAAHRSSTLDKIPEDGSQQASSTSRETLKNIAGIIGICILGSAAWVICWKTGLWTPAAAPGDEGGHSPGGKGERTPLGAEILGYISAVLYLGARIPQIYKNWREQSCEGLSLLFFLLSLIGNLTYGGGVSHLSWSCLGP